jgi:hypothetical protein
MEVEADSLYRAIFAYDCEQRTGPAHCRTFPSLTDETPVTVRAAGKVATGTLGQAKRWAQKWCEDRETREAAWKAAGHATSSAARQLRQK